jgi:hypothetical protein
MSDSTSELTFEIGGVEYTAILSDADESGGVRVSIRLPDDKVVLVTKPHEIFHSSAEAVNAARLFAAELKPKKEP